MQFVQQDEGSTQSDPTKTRSKRLGEHETSMQNMYVLRDKAAKGDNTLKTTKTTSMRVKTESKARRETNHKAYKIDV